MGTLAVGTELYDVMTTVGKGTFGEVAQGCQRSTGEMVAIKILSNRGNQGLVARNELRLLQALRGVDSEESHIIRFLEAFEDTAWTYLVFELLEQNLFDFQKQNNFSPLPVRHIRTITAQVLAALAKLGELSILHGDLKPQNIMLVDHGRHPFRVKLIDFGSASILPEVCHLKAPYFQTRFYRAPEVLLGLPFDEKVDVWSLGCVVAELHLGWPLHPGANEHEQVHHICSTLGPPRAELLGAAQKTSRFFRWLPHPGGSWKLRPLGREVTRSRHRRFAFSLEQLVGVNGRLTGQPGREELAERRDLLEMVELLKGMLTWDPRDRLSPDAALQHPFVTLQRLRDDFWATRYYQLCQEALQAAQKEGSPARILHGEEGGSVPSGRGDLQKSPAQLHPAEPPGDSVGEQQPGDALQQIPVLTRQLCWHQHPRMKPALSLPATWRDPETPRPTPVTI